MVRQVEHAIIKYFPSRMDLHSLQIMISNKEMYFSYQISLTKENISMTGVVLDNGMIFCG